jgi:hypothetical protein
MRRFKVLSFLIVFGFVCGMQAQAPATAPKPDPELKKLAVWSGHWTSEADLKPGPLGPGAKTTGEFTIRPILGGFFFEVQAKEKGPQGETHGLTIYEYDPANKNFPYRGYSDDGSTSSGIMTVSGSTYTFEEKFVVEGKEYRTKGQFILAADGMSSTYKNEISTDGKKWIPLADGKFTKTAAEK